DLGGGGEEKVECRKGLVSCASPGVRPPQSARRSVALTQNTMGLNFEFSCWTLSSRRAELPLPRKEPARQFPLDIYRIHTSLRVGSILCRILGSPPCVLRRAQDEGLSSCHEDFPSS